MSKPSKKRLEKKKNREIKSRKKILLRRNAIRKEAAENKRINKIEKEAEKQEPFRHMSRIHGATKTAEEIAAQIQRNFEILRALEDEYAKEMAEREGLNQALEAEGFVTLKEKLDYLSKKAEDSAAEAYETRIKNATEIV